jgi:RNA polymerase sigma-70 factor (ECF subfamily)
MRHYLGYSLEDIASTLEIPIGTVRSRLHYAVRQLRTVLDDERPLVQAEEPSA